MPLLYYIELWVCALLYYMELWVHALLHGYPLTKSAAAPPSTAQKAIPAVH